MSHKLELIHGDLCGPVAPTTPSGNRFFFLLVDDLSRYMWVALLSSKDGAMAAFLNFQARVEAETGRKVGTLCTDRGGEFTARAFIKHCCKAGIQQHLTAPYTPEQNGVVERRNQTIMGMARSMLKAMNLPGRLWGEAMATTMYILNRSPTQSVEGSTPYEVWHGSKPTVSHLRTFGCVAHVKQGSKRLTKLEDRSTPMVFVGYESGSKAWRFYDPNTRRVHVSRDVLFEEDRSWNWEEETGTDIPFGVEVVPGGSTTWLDMGASTNSPSSTTSSPSSSSNSPSSSRSTQFGCGVTHPGSLEDAQEQQPATAPGAVGVEFATPPTASPSLDADHNNTPIRFRTLKNI